MGAKTMEAERGIRYFPLALFTSVMGVSGLGLSLGLLEGYHDVRPVASYVVLVLASLLLLINVGILLYRLISFRDEVKQEFNHPVKMNFFAAISISLLLVAALYLDVQMTVSYILWLIGTVLQLVLTLSLLTLSMWKEGLQFAHFNPLWFLPIVGNIVVPLAGVVHASPLLNWMFFGIGIVFSIVYFTLFISRIFFHGPIPPPLRPTLFILLAPPGIATVSYIQMTGEADYFTYILYGFAIYIALLLLVQLRPYILAHPFTVSWWAFLFPSAIVTNATFLLFEHTGQEFLLYLFYIFLAAITLLTLYLLTMTLKALFQGKLCRKEG